MNELLPCPFCGKPPCLSVYGTAIDIECCVAMSIQKCDVLTLEERDTWSMDTISYGPEAEAKSLAAAIAAWNTRAPSNRYADIVERFTAPAAGDARGDKLKLDHLWGSRQLQGTVGCQKHGPDCAGTGFECVPVTPSPAVGARSHDHYAAECIEACQYHLAGKNPCEPGDCERRHHFTPPTTAAAEEAAQWLDSMAAINELECAKPLSPALREVYELNTARYRLAARALRQPTVTDESLGNAVLGYDAYCKANDLPQPTGNDHLRAMRAALSAALGEGK